MNEWKDTHIHTYIHKCSNIVFSLPALLFPRICLCQLRVQCSRRYCMPLNGVYW